MRTSTLVAVLVVAPFSLASQGAYGQTDFPNRMITVVVPSAAGSATDGAARTVAQELSSVAKQPVIVDNRPGAGGVIGTAYAAKALPDGYTIMLGNNGTHAANVTLFKSLQYDPIKDFAPIMLAERAPAFLVVNADSPIKSIDEFLRTARAKPGSASVGVFSVSGIVAATMLKSKANIDFVQIPYKTPSAGIGDLLGARLDGIFADVQNTISLVQNGKARVLAVTSRARVPTMPDIPTLSEAGVPDYELVSWGAYFAPRDTSPDIVATLNRLLRAAYTAESVRATSARFGMEIMASSPEELTTFLNAEIRKWSDMIRLSGYEQQ
jgi:tripartite-type tricarboxylate transporter receptor subunit TctC